MNCCLRIALILLLPVSLLANGLSTDAEKDEKAAREVLQALTEAIKQINDDAASRFEEAIKDPEKGEFETTKQFEARRSKHSENLFQNLQKLQRERLSRIAEVERRMAPLLRIEFTRSVKSRLGQYNADDETFPLYIEGSFNFVADVPVALSLAPSFKERFEKANSSVTFALFIDFRGRVTELPLGVFVELGGKSYSSQLSLDTDRAMKLLYSRFDLRSPIEFHKVEYLEGSFDGSEPAFAKPFFNREYLEDRKRKFVMLTAATPEEHDCHACGVLVGVAIFVNEGTGWKLQTATRSIGRYFSWGASGKPKLEKLGRDRHGAVFEWGDGNQGYFGGSFYIFSVVENSFREIGEIESYQDNSGALTGGEDFAHYKGKYQFVPGPHPQFFDFRVRYSGRKAVGKGRAAVVRPFSKTQLYRYTNGQYEKVSVPTRSARPS
jgi:hypothetical protein